MTKVSFKRLVVTLVAALSIIAVGICMSTTTSSALGTNDWQLVLNNQSINILPVNSSSTTPVKAQYYIAKGSTYTLEFNGVIYNTEKISVSSSDSKIAKVTSNDYRSVKVQAIKTGKVTLTAKIGKKSVASITTYVTGTKAFSTVTFKTATYTGSKITPKVSKVDGVSVDSDDFAVLSTGMEIINPGYNYNVKVISKGKTYKPMLVSATFRIEKATPSVKTNTTVYDDHYFSPVKSISKGAGTVTYQAVSGYESYYTISDYNRKVYINNLPSTKSKTVKINVIVPETTTHKAVNKTITFTVKNSTTLKSSYVTVPSTVQYGKEPSVKVKVGKTTLKKGTDYTVRYTPCNTLGMPYGVTITANQNSGKYSGTIVKNSKVIPATISSFKVVSKSKKTLQATWKAHKDASIVLLPFGYEIRASYSSKMSNSITLTADRDTTSYGPIPGLKSGKYVYCQIRAVGTNPMTGANVYGAWSSKVKVKIK